MMIEGDEQLSKSSVIRRHSIETKDVRRRITTTDTKWKRRKFEEPLVA
jgi:hypothetical protein